MAAKKAKPRKSRLHKPKPRRAKSKTGRRGRKGGLRRRKRARRFLRGTPSGAAMVSYNRRGLGARSGGQSGDTQGLSSNPAVDSESVEELAEEGQSFEAEVLNGVERAPDPDESEVYTKEVAEDDIPQEYLEKD